jgi:hypothetical protein
MTGFANCSAAVTGLFSARIPQNVDSHMNGHKIQQKNRATNFTRLFSSGAIRHAPIPLNTTHGAGIPSGPTRQTVALPPVTAF